MSDEDPAAAEAAAPIETRVREIQAEGRHWTVREHHWPTMDRRAGRSLVFECDDIMRRVRHFPSDWYSWSDADLYRLSLHA